MHLSELHCTTLASKSDRVMLLKTIQPCTRYKPATTAVVAAATSAAIETMAFSARLRGVVAKCRLHSDRQMIQLERASRHPRQSPVPRGEPAAG